MAPNVPATLCIQSPDHREFPTSLKSTKPVDLSMLERAVIGSVAGSIAGAFTHFVLFPLDTIKTKLQLKGSSSVYSTTLDAASKTFHEQGILQGFYRGLSAVVVGSAASSAVYFGTCELGKSVLSKFPKYPPLLIPPTAGAMANVISSAIMVPKELITQRMQAGITTQTTSSWEVLVNILKNDGILGLYAGYSATLLRNLPAGVLNYSSFEYLKGAVLRKKKEGDKVELEPIESVVCGALAGAISASLTTPLDVVKTRMMTSSAAARNSGRMAETVKRVLVEEGFVGFGRGIGARVVHGALFSAIGFLAFETAKVGILNRWLEEHEKRRGIEGVHAGI
ncbi:Protein MITOFERRINLIKE 1, chloroplastic [Linum grandiflorum]